MKFKTKLALTILLAGAACEIYGRLVKKKSGCCMKTVNVQDCSTSNETAEGEE